MFLLGLWPCEGREGEDLPITFATLGDGMIRHTRSVSFGILFGAGFLPPSCLSPDLGFGRLALCQVHSQ